MKKNNNQPNILSSKIGRRSSFLFFGISVMAILIIMFNWYADIKPRLISEAEFNSRSLGTAQARSVEALFQNVITNRNTSVIHNALNEMLLFTDPSTNEPLYNGIRLEVDYDVLPIFPDLLNFSVGSSNCENCITTQNPIYNHQTGELIAILTINANPIFYQRLVQDIALNLILIIASLLLMLALGWITIYRLFAVLRKRESNLVTEIAERQVVEDQLQQIAIFDQLTGLPNRYQLHTEFTKKLEESERNGNILACLFFDLDHFKKINDVYGHETGDNLLTEVTARMSQVTRNYDLLSRFGGDEFVMIMSNIQHRTDVIPVVDKIVSLFEQAFELESVSVQVTTSIGISIYPFDGLDPSALLKNADMAMYRAKAHGRNCYQFFNQEMNRELQRSQWIESHLKSALSNNELILKFQPHRQLKSGDIHSCEALIRWPQHSTDDIEPSEFIAIAEKTDLIHQISRWVLQSACQQLQEWKKAGYEPVRIDINLSGKDIIHQDIYDIIDSAIKEYDLQPSQLGIEITENILLQSSESVIQILSELRDLGIFIWIDDFGTGYSSLNYLKQFPLTGLKIDQSFIHQAPDNKNDRVILDAIVTVGHGLGLKVTAEGVETENHLLLCQKVGCDSVQGHYISKPLNADNFADQFLKPTGR